MVLPRFAQHVRVPDGYATTIRVRGADVPDDSSYAIHVTVTAEGNRNRQTWISRDALVNTETSLQAIIDDAVYRLNTARDSQSMYDGKTEEGQG